jgi:hypothetical protein
MSTTENLSDKPMRLQMWEVRLPNVFSPLYVTYRNPSSSFLSSSYMEDTIAPKKVNNPVKRIRPRLFYIGSLEHHAMY